MISSTKRISFYLIIMHLVQIQGMRLITPLNFATDTLVNIVTNDGLYTYDSIKYEACMESQYSPLITYVSWTTNGLNLRIPDFGLRQNLTLKMHYFQIQHKLGSEKIIFILVTEGNFLQTARAIDNSGFGSSSAVPFFVLLNPSSGNVMRRFTKSLENQLRFISIRPFYAPIIFFSHFLRVQIVFCYYCPGATEKLWPIHTFSVEYSLMFGIISIIMVTENR